MPAAKKKKKKKVGKRRRAFHDLSGGRIPPGELNVGVIAVAACVGFSVAHLSSWRFRGRAARRICLAWPNAPLWASTTLPDDRAAASSRPACARRVGGILFVRPVTKGERGDCAAQCSRVRRAVPTRSRTARAIQQHAGRKAWRPDHTLRDLGNGARRLGACRAAPARSGLGTSSWEVRLEGLADAVVLAPDLPAGRPRLPDGARLRPSVR